jgi:hypothetical protein
MMCYELLKMHANHPKARQPPARSPDIDSIGHLWLLGVPAPLDLARRTIQ